MSWIDDARMAHPSQLPDTELPRDYQGLTLAAVPQADVREIAQGYLRHFWSLAEQGKAPGFFGRSATFKTWAASVVCETVSQQGLLPALYVAAGPEFAFLERRRFDDAIEGRLAVLRTTPFVVLDDITDVRQGTIAMDFLNEVVKHRDASGLPTLYTGNALFTPTQPDALIQQFGASMTRRVLEGTKGHLVILK